MLRNILIAYALIGWLAGSIFLGRAFTPRPAAHRAALGIVIADAILMILVGGSIWRDWTA